jgi:hypothetical protein
VYVEAAASVADGEYRAPSEPTGVPRYPPGFPLLLAPSVAIAGDAGARATATAIGALLVAVVWFASRELAGDLAATIAGLLWVLSPMVRDYASDVMSDPAAAALVVIGVVAANRGRWVLAGLAWGGSSAVRLIHASFLPALGRRRAGWIAAAAVLAPLALFQLKTYGRLAGYDGSEAEFSLSHVLARTPLVVMSRQSEWTNLEFFPGLLFGLSGSLVPGLPLFAAYEMWTRRGEAVVAAAAWIVAANVLVYLPYYFQAARFMLPAACLMIVFASAGVVSLVRSLQAERQRPRPVAAL